MRGMRRAMGRVVPVDEFEIRRRERETGERFCRCGSCGMWMPEPENPCGTERAIFSTCDSCVAKREMDGRSER